MSKAKTNRPAATDWTVIAASLGITPEEMAQNRAAMKTSNLRPAASSDAERASIARDAVLHGGRPAPEYQTRPDAYERECEEENA